LDERGFSEFDLALAFSASAYARGLVGNRARRSLTSVDDDLGRQLVQMQKRQLVDKASDVWKSSSACFEHESDDAESESDDEEAHMDVDLQDIAKATTLVRMQALSRKARRVHAEDSPFLRSGEPDLFANVKSSSKRAEIKQQKGCVRGVWRPPRTKRIGILALAHGPKRRLSRESVRGERRSSAFGRVACSCVAAARLGHQR